MEATVENCGPEGFCAEIGIPLSKGTILVVQMAGDSVGDGWQGGFRSHHWVKIPHGLLIVFKHGHGGRSKWRIVIYVGQQPLWRQ